MSNADGITSHAEFPTIGIAGKEETLVESYFSQQRVHGRNTWGDRGGELVFDLEQ
jgi:hypothetical protein